MTDKPRPNVRQVPVKHVYPDELTTRYASQIVVQHDPEVFIVSFFEAIPPLVMGTSEEIKSGMENIKHVDAKCVARIVLTPGKMKEFVQIAKSNLDKYIKNFEFNAE